MATIMRIDKPTSERMTMVDFMESPTQTIEVQHRSEMSTEEIFNTWYTQEELSAMISENSRSCFLLQKSKYLGEFDEFCYRGLEHIFLPDYRVRRQKVMRDAFDSVILEQDRQLINNSFNEELIASTYREAVLYAKTIARRRGMRDEEEARDEPRTTRSPQRGSPSKKLTRKPGLKVNFAESVSSRFIPGLQSISNEEKESCWIGRNEYLAMKVLAINDINGYMGGKVSESDDFTTRGLEAYLPNLAMIRKRNRMHANNAVFEEQELQELEGTNCPDRISKAYQSNSIHCLLVAQVVAQQDATELSATSARKESRKSHCAPAANLVQVTSHLPKAPATKTQFHRLQCA